jgi:hypothetical protein
MSVERIYINLRLGAIFELTGFPHGTVEVGGRRDDGYHLLPPGEYSRWSLYTEDYDRLVEDVTPRRRFLSDEEMVGLLLILIRPEVAGATKKRLRAQAHARRRGAARCQRQG